MTIDYDTLFGVTDNFCQGFEAWYQEQLITDGRLKRCRSGRLKLSEVLTILLAYYSSGKTCLKYFYFDLWLKGRHLFTNLLTYHRQGGALG